VKTTLRIALTLAVVILAPILGYLAGLTVRAFLGI